MFKMQELQLQVSLCTSSTLHMEVGWWEGQGEGRWGVQAAGAAAADVPTHL